MGPSAIGLKAMVEMCGVDRVLFGSDFGPVPMSPKLHIDLIDDTITDEGDRNKIFSTNTLALLCLAGKCTSSVPASLLSLYARAPWGAVCGSAQGEVAVISLSLVHRHWLLSKDIEQGHALSESPLLFYQRDRYKNAPPRSFA